MNKRDPNRLCSPFSVSRSRPDAQFCRIVGPCPSLWESCPQSCGSDFSLDLCAQVATHPAAPASARGPLIACSAGRQRTCCSLTSPWKELYVAFASPTAKPGFTWIAQESANVSRGWEQLFKAFGIGLQWIFRCSGWSCTMFDSYVLWAPVFALWQSWMFKLSNFQNGIY